MQALGEILRDWPQLWKSPKLAEVVDQSEQPDVERLARSLVRDLAYPGSRRGIVSDLIQRGEFRRAETLLGRQGFQQALDDAAIDQFFEQLDTAREAAKEVTYNYAESLRARAARVDAPQDILPTDFLDVVDQSRPQAESWLEKWESEVRAKEAEVAKGIRTEMDRQFPDPGASEAVRTWRRCVGELLEFRDFDTARRLVEQGPEAGAAAVAVPVTIPRLNPWPFDEPLTEVLEWFEGRGGPRGFDRRWFPQPDDSAAAAMLNDLRRLTDATTFDAELVTSFAETFDRFLGTNDPAVRSAEPCQAGFETQVFGLFDARWPCPGIRDGGTRIRVVRDPDANRNVFGEPSSPFRLELSVSNVVVPLHLSVILEAVHRPQHRRINLLRDIGGRMPIQQVLRDRELLIPIPGDEDERRLWMGWLFDITGIDVTDGAIFDMIEFYAGTPQSLLSVYFYSLLSSLKERDQIVSDDLIRTWRSAEFRDAAYDLILRPLDSEAGPRIALALVHELETQPGGELSVEEIELLYEDFAGKPASAEQIRPALDRLVQLGLLEVDGGTDMFRLPTTGIGYLTRNTISHPQLYAREGLDAALLSDDE